MTPEEFISDKTGQEYNDHTPLIIDHKRLKRWLGEYAQQQNDWVRVEDRLPSNPEIYRWLKDQQFQTEQGPQEYKMYFDVDMPKILKRFAEYFIQRLKAEQP